MASDGKQPLWQRAQFGSEWIFAVVKKNLWVDETVVREPLAERHGFIANRSDHRL
jgi:hypothetical protein